MHPKQIVPIYFLIQGISTAAWWLLLFAYPPSVKWFQPSDWPAGALLSFWLADFVLIITGSVIAATGILRQHEWAGNAVWAVTVLTWYPILVCLATSNRNGTSVGDRGAVPIRTKPDGGRGHRARPRGRLVLGQLQRDRLFAGRCRAMAHRGASGRRVGPEVAIR